MKVRDPQGQAWRVSHRWLPWRRRVREIDDSTPDLTWADGLGDDPISLVIAVVAFILLAPFVLLVVVAGLEMLLLLALLPIAVLGRVLLGRAWTVEVRRGWKPWWEGPAGDWQASTLKIHEIADAIRGGQLPPRTLGREEGAEAR